MICLLPHDFVSWAWLSGQTEYHGFLVSSRGSEVPPQVWLFLFDLCGILNRSVFGIQIWVRASLLCAEDLCFPHKLVDGQRDKLSLALFASKPHSIDPQWEVTACGSSDSICQNFWRENLTYNKNCGWSLPSFLVSTFCLRTTSKNQMCWCQSCAVIAERIWKCNWKQTWLSKADLGKLWLWGRREFQVFPLFGADVSEHLFCEMNHLWILHLGVIYWEMAFFLNVEET